MNSLFNLFGSLLNKHGRYKVFGKTIKLADKPVQSLLGKQNIPATITSNVSYYAGTNGSFTNISKNAKKISIVDNHYYLIAGKSVDKSKLNQQMPVWIINYNTWYYNHKRSTYIAQDSDWALAKYNSMEDSAGEQPCGFWFQANESHTVNALIVFDLTELGLDDLTAQQFYERFSPFFDKLANGDTLPAIYEADLSEATFSNDDGTQTQKVSILQNGQPLKLGGIGTAKDYYLNASGKVNRAIGKRAYQSGDENDTSVITDMTNTWYVLQTPTTEQANSVMLRKGFTKCYDKNNLELEIEIIDPLNFSNKIVQGKNAPTITAEKVITKGFTSGDEHFTQLYIYEDGEIWYVNSQGSAQAYANGVGWEIEYKTLKFDDKVSLTESERNALLNIYDLL